MTIELLITFNVKKQPQNLEVEIIPLGLVTIFLVILDQ
jgi:hypothetical protein